MGGLGFSFCLSCPTDNLRAEVSAEYRGKRFHRLK